MTVNRNYMTKAGAIAETADNALGAAPTDISASIAVEDSAVVFLGVPGIAIGRET